MSGLILTLTNAGRAALINGQSTGTASVLVASIGITAQAFVADAAATVLPGEIKRLATFAGAVVADDTIHVTIRDDGPDTYTVRGFALYLDDGTLLGLYGQATPVMDKSAQAMLLLSADIRFVDLPVTVLTFGDASFVNPAATTEVVGVVELATPAETVDGLDPDRAVTPDGLRAALDAFAQRGRPLRFYLNQIAL